MAGAEIRLDPLPASVPQARHWLRGALDLGGRFNVDAACVLVSELVTNALLHACTPITVRAYDDARRLRVEIADTGTESPPSPNRDAGHEAESGRGLHIVSELADAWGLEPNVDDERGTVAWFELDSADASEAESQDDEATG